MHSKKDNESEVFEGKNQFNLYTHQWFATINACSFIFLLELFLEFLQQHCQEELTRILAAELNDQYHVIEVRYAELNNTHKVEDRKSVV